MAPLHLLPSILPRMQIAFLLLFLGLTLGVSPVEPSIDGPARLVEMVLDIGVPVAMCPAHR